MASSGSRRWSSPASATVNASSTQTVTSSHSPSYSHVSHHSSVTTLSTSKVFDLSSLYNERAGPRIDSSLILRDLHAQSPTPSTASPASTPDYTHVTNLYPSLQPQQQRHSDGSAYRYSPATASASTVTTATMSLPQQQTQAMPPEGHVGASFGPLSVDVRDSPTLSITSVSSSKTDPEAEVDALTNLLLQGLDTVGRKHRSRHSQSSTSTLVNSSVTSINSNLSNNNNVNDGERNNANLNNVSVSPPVVNNNGGITGADEASVDNAVAVRSRTTRQPPHECFRCHRTIPVGEHVHLSALRTRFHVSCFSCYACGIGLAAPGQATSSSSNSPSNASPPAAYFHAGDRLLCDRCVLTTVENCHACERPIAERMLRALGHAYHPSCFVCYACQKSLDGQPFTVDVHGRIHCLEDFHQRYAPRCHKCEEPIAPGPGENEARRVVTGGQSYHVACFRRK